MAERVADSCRGEILITMLADDAAVEAVLFGEGGAGKSLPAGAIHVSMSTISITLSERLERMHQERGQIYGTAPVFGRPEAAAAAKLFIVAAGPTEAIERCQPLFDAMGQKAFVIGEKPSDANLIKLSGNFLIAATIESLGGAIALARKSGIDAHRYIEILTGTHFSSPVFNNYGAIIADENYEPAGFKMALGFKDIRLAPPLRPCTCRCPSPALCATTSFAAWRGAKATVTGRRWHGSAREIRGFDARWAECPITQKASDRKFFGHAHRKQPIAAVGHMVGEQLSTRTVPAGGFVRRVARTQHYDGVKKGAAPAIIGIFGIAPVDLKLVDPSKLAWRHPLCL
jgi:3-hydroxyisobutyrate dehydrogenase-like beta-hydroxyacid dehydrogenase